MAERQSMIDNDNIKGYFEIYMDNQFQGMRVDYEEVQSLHLTSISTQTETPIESIEIKFLELLKQNEELQKENQDLKSRNNRLKRKIEKKTKRNKYRLRK